MLRIALAASGYNVLATGDGRWGIAIINDQAEKIDMLLLDIALPFVSGFKLSEVLKPQRPATKCLVTSGYDQPLLSVDDKSSNYRFIEKPLRLHELRALIGSPAVANPAGYRVMVVDGHISVWRGQRLADRRPIV